VVTDIRPAQRKVVVLDTNVALDLLVFCDPRAAPLAQALLSGYVSWIACPAMRIELERTLSYPAVQRRLKSAQDVLTRFDELTSVTAAPRLAPLQGMRCADPDDQVFVDLALENGATWLLSHDLMVQRLAPGAAARGLWIGPPSGFAMHRTPLVM
jgi:predicted nucleic acid-binding protein